MPELYQLIGTVLRDIAEARHMSDLYSRQVSHRYEEDSLLRRFPVPRAEISEAEFELKFAVEEVSLDVVRHAARSAKLSIVFDKLSRQIVLHALQVIKHHLESARVSASSAKLEATWKRLDAKDYRDQLIARFVRYFEGHQSDLVLEKAEDRGTKELKRDEIVRVIGTFVNRLVTDDLDIRSLFTELHPDHPEQITADIQEGSGALIDRIQPEVSAAYDECSDFKVQVSIKPTEIQAAGVAVSSVRVKAVMKNYIWDKIDVDEQVDGEDIRSVRALNPE